MRLLAPILIVALASNTWAADEWPQFRGPDGQGHTDAVGLPTEWSESQNITWKTAIPGAGHSSPVVGGGLAWLTTAFEDGKSLQVVAIDVNTGRIVHEREVLRTDSPPHVNVKNSHASPTPVLDGDRVYVHFGTSGTVCLSTATAETLWTNQELRIEHQEGPGSSPIVWKNLLIVNCDGSDVQYVAALDKLSGQIVWKTPRSGPVNPTPDYRKAFSTPLVIEVAGEPLLVSPGAHRVVAYDPATGQEKWFVRYSPGFSNVPRPLYGHGLLYICTGYMRAELWAIRPDGAGDATDSHVAWKFTQNVPTNPSPVLVDDELYMVSDTGITTCMDAKSGKQRWRQRLADDTYWSSPLAADGKIYFSSEGGDTTVIEPGHKFKRLAVNKLDADIMASAAVVDSALLVRTRTHLYRIEAPRDSAARLSKAD